MVSLTDRGRMRDQNEDRLAFDAGRGYALLADGMGGCNAGEVASRIAVEAAERAIRSVIDGGGFARMLPLDAERAVADCVSAANAAVYGAALAEARYAGMGTTLTGAAWRAEGVIVANVGDSRIYRMRERRLAQLTRDHSLLQEHLDRGRVETASRRDALRHVVTRALGVDPDVRVDVATHEARDGDCYLLCSDGLTDMVDDAILAEILADAGERLAGAAQALVSRANANGGRDNISVILCRVRRRGRQT